MISEKEHPVLLGSHVSTNERLDFIRTHESENGVRKIREATVSVEEGRKVGCDERLKVVADEDGLRVLGENASELSRKRGKLGISTDDRGLLSHQETVLASEQISSTLEGGIWEVGQGRISPSSSTMSRAKATLKGTEPFLGKTKESE